MVPESPDTLQWIARGLALPLLEERDGVVRRLSDSRAPLPTLEAEISRETGADVATFTIALGAARHGRSSRQPIGPDTVLFLWPVERGVRALVAPDTLQLAERAGAADVAAEVTHEVANSLTAIAGWTQLAAATPSLPARVSHALDVVQRSTNDALLAARQLLSTMRSSIAPPVAAMESATEVGPTLEQVLETLRPTLDRSGIRVDAECVPGLWVGLSPATLRSVLDNLVRNAGEALREAGVSAPRITVQAGRSAEGGQLVVWDNGPGVPENIRTKLFDRYVSTKATGTGLGLALIRDAVERSGGTIRLDSSQPGARFIVTMPSAQATVPDRVLPDEAPEPNTIPPDTGSSDAASGVHRRPSIRGRTVLIVDDDHATRSMVATALELSGAIVRTAESYEDALGVRSAYDIALVDVHLGDGRGDDLLGELRRRGLGLAVILTGSQQPLSPEARPDAVLRKPFQLEELERLLDALLTPRASLSEESSG